MRKFGSFMLGAILGGLISSSLVILLTPESGEDLRHKIEVRFKDIIDEVNRAADEKRAELEDQLRTLRSGSDVKIEEKGV